MIASRSHFKGGVKTTLPDSAARVGVCTPGAAKRLRPICLCMTLMQTATGRSVLASLVLMIEDTSLCNQLRTPPANLHLVSANNGRSGLAAGFSAAMGSFRYVVPRVFISPNDRAYPIPAVLGACCIAQGANFLLPLIPWIFASRVVYSGFRILCCRSRWSWTRALHEPSPLFCADFCHFCYFAGIVWRKNL